MFSIIHCYTLLDDNQTWKASRQRKLSQGWPLLGRVALGAQRPIVAKLSRKRSVCPVHCGKRQIDTDAVWRHRSDVDGKGYFWAHHCNQWGLYSVRVRQRRDAALFPNYFKQTCCCCCFCCCCCCCYYYYYFYYYYFFMPSGV